ncbi:unnamed protein product [Rotaria socialis]|uniref:Chorein N-terminal domain-containing protein n=1 Tax=Rotaria socialis TaxID=392032 RepID=A0A817U8Z2_9BILA|nr:unnamed protein product [Rotaria socialis]CAF3348224.1 unnamed protein product [Rotaria socialis]
MVFKSIIRYIINRYLKNYIEELDDEKLNFDLIHENVTLENLRLKPEALADLNLPVAVAAGCVEKLVLTIPWMNLHSNPTKIHINGLYILVVPKNESDQDLTEHHANKMRRVLQKVQNLRRIMLVLYPTNMDVNMIIIITDGEHNFDRSTFNIDIKIRQLALNIDSTQFSDLLDFAKFQNYSTLYDRCREYRQLYLQESTDNTLLNQEQKERLKVNKISFCWFSLSCKIS